MSPPGPWEPATVDERLDRLESLAAIRQLPYRYAVAVDSRDIEMLVDLFVPDVRVGTEASGREALKGWYTATLNKITHQLPEAYPSWHAFWERVESGSG